jgi:hypothetical protein
LTFRIEIPYNSFAFEDKTMARKKKSDNSAIAEATGVSETHIAERVAMAYVAKFGKDPGALSYSSIVADPEVLGRVHFNVIQGGRKIGEATFKPRHKSVWVNWQ